MAHAQAVGTTAYPGGPLPLSILKRCYSGLKRTPLPLFSGICTLAHGIFRIPYSDRCASTLCCRFNLNPIALQYFVGILAWPHHPCFQTGKLECLRQLCHPLIASRPARANILSAS